MATYKKELPDAYRERATGKTGTYINILPNHYITETDADTITIPFMMYQNLLAEHQPERYLRAMEKVNIIRRLAEAKRSDGSTMIDIDVILMVCGAPEKDTWTMQINTPIAIEVTG